jgi:plastocyanin
MQGIRFSPKTLTVKVGQPVKWKNEDSVDHNVTATSGASFHSPAFGQGGSYTFTPTKPGTISYVCTLHPGMAGKLMVQR